MKTILLPTDFSDNAKNAIVYALHLYKTQKVKFILFNAFHPTHDNLTNTIIGSGLNDFLSKEVDGKLQKLIEEVKAINNNGLHTFSYKANFGSLVDLLNNFIAKHPINLIVMGAKGMSAVEKIIFGSNTYSIIKEIDCPVLVIPSNIKFLSPTKIGIASDFEPLKNTSIFSELKTVISDYKAAATVFNITDVEQNTTKEALNYAEKLAINLGIEKVEAQHYQHEDLIEGTNEFIKNKGINLLVLLNKKRNFLQNLFHISFTKQIAFHAQVPFLVLHS